MKALLIIDGMKTVHCVRAVFQALAGVPGVHAADVSLGRAVLLLDGAPNEPALREALSVLGYQITSTSPLGRELPLLMEAAP